MAPNSTTTRSSSSASRSPFTSRPRIIRGSEAATRTSTDYCDNICPRAHARVPLRRPNAITSPTISIIDRGSDTTSTRQQRYSFATKPCCTCSLNLRLTIVSLAVRLSGSWHKEDGMNQMIVDAIRKRRRLRFTYNDNIRIAEPQCYGIGVKGTELLRV